MPDQLFLLFLLVVFLPCCWLLSEFQNRRWVRILLGVASLSLSFFIATVIGFLQQLNYNSSYGFASAKLLDSTISELEANRADRLLPALRTLRKEFQPTYENRAQYDQLIDKFADQLATNHNAGEVNSSGKPHEDQASPPP